MKIETDKSNKQNLNITKVFQNEDEHYSVELVDNKLDIYERLLNYFNDVDKRILKQSIQFK